MSTEWGWGGGGVRIVKVEGVGEGNGGFGERQRIAGTLEARRGSEEQTTAVVLFHGPIPRIPLLSHCYLISSRDGGRCWVDGGAREKHNQGLVTGDSTEENDIFIRVSHILYS